MGKLKSGKVGVGGKQFKGCLWPTVSRGGRVRLDFAFLLPKVFEVIWIRGRVSTSQIANAVRKQILNCCESGGDSDNISGLVVPAILEESEILC